MYRYTVDGVELASRYREDSSINQEEQLSLLETIDHALYEQFEQALLDNGVVFQMVLNGVELECRYTIRRKLLLHRYSKGYPQPGVLSTFCRC